MKNSNKATLSNRKRYTDGVSTRYFTPGTEPEGWIVGTPDSTKQKLRQISVLLWEDEAYRLKQAETRSTTEYHDKIVLINKTAWLINHESRCEALSVAANVRWNDESLRLAQSKRLQILWSDVDYKTSQSIAIKEGHEDIYNKHPEYLEKISQGNKLAWKENKEDILLKLFVTKTENNSWNTSELEESFYLLLKETYSEDNIVRLYRDTRYPFNCDFYIKSEDRFIELQGTWTHGKHPFNPESPDDLKLLEEWKKLALTSDYYKTAVYVWSVLDPLKRKIAIENNLNIEFIY